MKKELVLITGGAGFIGSHLVDALIAAGYRVRVLDNLTRPAHDGTLPSWFNREAEFINGDVRNARDWLRALKGVSYVMHLAAYMDMFSDFSTYFAVNAAGTALLYETIVKHDLPIKKIIAASSQSVYGEGKYRCPKHGIIYPDVRPLSALKRHQWDFRCPEDRKLLTPLPQREDDLLKPLGAYGAAKVATEHILFSLGKLYNIPSVALRFSIVQGARQSFRHFYSGALRAYAVMAITGQTVVTHEDGKQMRDFVSVHDVVDAHIKVLTDRRTNFQAFNVGSGKSICLLDLARAVKNAAHSDAPVRAGRRFRWATARHSLMDISKLKKLGWAPKYTVEDNAREYIAWVKNYPEAKRYLAATDRTMKKSKLLF